MSQPTIRTFLACELSSASLTKVDQLLRSLKTDFPRSVKWVNPKNIHLTIKFIGEFDPSHLELIQSSLTKTLQSFKPFQLEIKGMGVFPSPSKPKVIWLGIDAGESLINMVNIVNRESDVFGYAPERRPFSAHITLGRVKSYASRDDMLNISKSVKAQQNIFVGSQMIDQLHFIKSDLTRSGPIYKTLFTIPFSG